MATETEKKKEPQPIAICRSIKVLSCGEFVVVKAICTQNGELCTRVKSAQQLYLLHIAFCFSFLLVVSLALVYRIIFRSPISNCNCFAVSCSQSWVQCTQNFPFLPSPHPHALLTATKQAVWTGGDGADTSSNLTAFRFLCFAALSFLFFFLFLIAYLLLCHRHLVIYPTRHSPLATWWCVPVTRDAATDPLHPLPAPLHPQ